jgi:hypothetical protein
MANQTVAQKITELEAELVLVKAQQASASAGGQSFTLGDLSVFSVNYAALRDRRRDIEKSLQRLYRGGRGFVVDMSHPGTDTPDGDNTVYTRVQA